MFKSLKCIIETEHDIPLFIFEKYSIENIFIIWTTNKMEDCYFTISDSASIEMKDKYEGKPLFDKKIDLSILYPYKIINSSIKSFYITMDMPLVKKGVEIPLIDNKVKLNDSVVYTLEDCLNEWRFFKPIFE